MPQMDEKTLETLIEETGLTDAWMTSEIDTQAAGAGVSDIVGAEADPLTRLLRLLFVDGWALLMALVRMLIPQLFLRYATGHWLDEHAGDNGLLRDPGTQTRLLLDLTKDAALPLTIPAGTVFYVLEANPRRYQTLAEVSPADAATDFSVEVQALCPTSTYSDGRTFYHSARYNPTTYGTDPETDEALRGRIFSLRDLKNFELGAWLYYERLLKTVAGVAHVTLDATDPNTGSMSMTLYGATGQLTQEALDAVQALFDQKKMLTDQGTLNQATPLNLDLEVLFTSGGTGGEVSQLVADFFQGLYNGSKPGITRGAGVESCDLHDYLQETWPQIRTRITPSNAVLPTGKFFVPTTTTGAL